MSQPIPTTLVERKPLVQIEWTKESEEQYRAGPLVVLRHRPADYWVFLLDNRPVFGTDGCRCEYYNVESAMRAAPRIKSIRERMKP